MTIRLRATVLAGVVTALLALAVGCASGPNPSASPSSTASPFVGFWTGSSDIGGPLLTAIDRGSTTYRVALDGLPARAAPMVNGRLVVQRANHPSEGVPNLTQRPWYGLELAWQHNRVIAIYTQDGKMVASSSLRRVTEANYRRQANETADQAMRMATLSLFIAAERWQERHGGRPPSEAQMKPGSPVADLVPGHQWPLSPYSLTPVRQGKQAGDFAYATDGNTFRLAGHLSGGKDFAAP